MSMQSHLAGLKRRHDALAKEIDTVLLHPATDELEVKRLKQKKLLLKDEIERLRGEPTQRSLH